MKKTFNWIWTNLIFEPLCLVLIFVVPAVFLLGCQPRESDYGSEVEIGYSIVKIEGCEYILYRPSIGHLAGLAHKGNCTNEIHIYKGQE